MTVSHRAFSIAASVALLASCEAKSRSFSNALEDAGVTSEDASPANGESNEGNESPPDDAGGTPSDSTSSDDVETTSALSDDDTTQQPDSDASVGEGTDTASTIGSSSDEMTSSSGGENGVAGDASSSETESSDTSGSDTNGSESSETSAGGSAGSGGQATGGDSGATAAGGAAGAETGAGGSGGAGTAGQGAGGDGGAAGGGTSGTAGSGTAGTGGSAGAGGNGGTAGAGANGGSGGTGGSGCTLDEECPPPNDPCSETAVCNNGTCEAGPSPCGELPAGCECAELGSSICGVAAVDNDGDNFGTTECSLLPGDDCDDDAPLVYPRAPELCDGIDNDCDDLPDLLDGAPLHGTNQTLVLAARQPRIDWSSTADVFGVSWAGAGLARFNTMSPLGALSASPATTFWQAISTDGTFTNNAVAANTLGFGLLGVITDGVIGPVQQTTTFFHLAPDAPQTQTPLDGSQPCPLGLTSSGDRGWLYCGRTQQGLVHAFLPLGNDATPTDGPDLQSIYVAGATLMPGAPVGAMVGWDAVNVGSPSPAGALMMAQHIASWNNAAAKPTVAPAWSGTSSYATVVGAVGAGSFATAWRYEGETRTWFGNVASPELSCGPVIVAEHFVPLKMLPFGSDFLILGMETSEATPALAVALVAANCEVLSLPLLVGPAGTADALSPDFAAGGHGVAVVWTENNNVRRRVFGLNLCDAPTP